MKVFYAGLLVGTLDILSALIDYFISTGKNPIVVFKFIAAGIFGMEAITGGNEMIVLGLLLHYVIAFSFTILFWFLYPKFNLLAVNKVITAILLGTIIWAIMNFLILPLSQIPERPFNWFNSIKALIILICFIGLPLSFIANRYFSKQRPVLN